MRHCYLSYAAFMLYMERYKRKSVKVAYLISLHLKIPFCFSFVVWIGTDSFTLWWNVVKAVNLKLVKPFFIHLIVVLNVRETSLKYVTKILRTFWKISNTKKTIKIIQQNHSECSPWLIQRIDVKIRLTIANKTIQNLSKQEKSTIPFWVPAGLWMFHTYIIHV